MLDLGDLISDIKLGNTSLQSEVKCTRIEKVGPGTGNRKWKGKIIHGGK